MGAYPAAYVPGSPWVRTRQLPTLGEYPAVLAYPAALAYPAVPGCVPGSAYPAALGCVPGSLRTRQLPTLDAYPAARTLRGLGLGLEPNATRRTPTSRCVPGGAYPAARKTTLPAKDPYPTHGKGQIPSYPVVSGPVRSTAHGPMEQSVRTRQQLVRTRQQTEHTNTGGKKSPRPRRRQPPSPRPPLGTPPFGGRGSRRPPGERKRGGPPSSPGTFSGAQTRRPPPLRPSSPRSPASPGVPPIPLLGPPVRRAPGGKSRRRRAYPQQIVTTRLLYCLQDPFAQLSRLQRI